MGGLVIAGLAPAGQGMDDWLLTGAGLTGAGGPGNRAGVYLFRNAVGGKAGRMIAAKPECGAFARLRFAAGVKG